MMEQLYLSNTGNFKWGYIAVLIIGVFSILIH